MLEQKAIYVLGKSNLQGGIFFSLKDFVCAILSSTPWIP